MPPKNAEDENDEHEEELELEEEGEGEEEENEEDRGDLVHPEETAAKLKKLAGEEADDEETEEGEEEESEREGYIPRARFDEVNTQVGKLREQVARLEGRAEATPKKEEPAAKKVDLDELEEQISEAVLAGDTAKAKQLRAEHRAALKAEAKGEVLDEVDQRIAKERQQAAAEREQERMSDVAEEMFEKFPFLDHTDKTNRNMSAVRQVIALRDSYVTADGLKPHVALRKASEEIGKLYVKQAKKAAAADDDGEEEEAPAPAAKPKTAQEQRKVVSLRRNATAAGQQPAAVKGSGIGGRAQESKIDPTELSEEEFKGLSEKQKAEMRGDII